MISIILLDASNNSDSDSDEKSSGKRRKQNKKEKKVLCLHSLIIYVYVKWMSAFFSGEEEAQEA